MPVQDPNTLIHLFNGLFQSSYRTRLIRGGKEPLYLPSTTRHCYHQLIFTQGYYSSALHEIAHWCIAGHERRQRIDFGYWYLPDGRNAEQQKAFEEVEVAPQALECLFAEAAGLTFRPSTDNLHSDQLPGTEFFERIQRRKEEYLRNGLPERAGQFLSALHRRYGLA